MTSQERIASRVARGVAWLDRWCDEDWHGQVDLGRLDQSDPSRCVLGQLQPGGRGYY